LSARIERGTIAARVTSENVGAHSQFMRSSAHRANILDSDMDSIGIGVAERGGQLFVVEDFANAK